MRKCLVLAAALAAALAPSAWACNEYCSYTTGRCEQAGWTTYQACQQVGSSCVDIPVDCSYSERRPRPIAEAAVPRLLAPPSALPVFLASLR